MGPRNLLLRLCLALIVPVATGDISSLIDHLSHVEGGDPLLGSTEGDPSRLQVLSELLTPTRCGDSQVCQDQLLPNVLAEAIVEPEEEDSCGQHLQLYLRDLKQMKFWALSMLDASGKIPDGIIRGHLNTLGNYDQCIGIEERNLDIRGEYCLVMIKTKIIPIPILKGLCVPASCSYQQIQALLDTVVNNRSMNSTWFVTEDSCSTKDVLPWRLGDKIFVSVMVFMLAVVLMCSCYDAVDRFFFVQDKPIRTKISRYHSRTFLLEKEDTESVFTGLAKSISVFYNFEKIFTINPVSKGITCIHGLRFLSMCWVVLGHSVAFGSILQYTNLLDAVDYFRMLSAQSVFNATVAVDTFLVMSGALASYGMFAFFQKLKSAFPVKKIAFLYFTRYIRLTPALAVIIGFMATVNILVSDGPFWKFGSRPNEKNCINYWWSNLLYVQNYVNVDKLCLPHGWYLACDMHYFLISPFLIILFARHRILGIITTCCLILASNLFVSVSTYINNYPPSFTLSLEYQSSVKSYTENIYFKSHARFGPYGIGLLLGLLLVEFKDKKWKPSKILVAMCWLISTTSSLAIIYGLYEYNHTVYGKGSRLGAAVYGGFHRTVWGICIGWIIFACHHGQGGIINHMLSLQIFIPLGRLTYCTYLLSLIIQYDIVISLRDSIYFDGFLNPYLIFLGSLSFILVISTAVTLAVESPWIGITRIVQGKKFAANRRQESQNVLTAFIYSEKQMEETEIPNGEPQKSAILEHTLSHM